MKFFEIKSNLNDRTFVYASGYGPLNGPMPFLHDQLLENRRKFWEVNPSKPGLKISQVGFKWPDCLGNGNSPPPYFLSNKILRSLESENIPIARCTPMPIAVIRSKSKKISEVIAPSYFVVEADPGIEIDYPKSGIPIDKQGKPILDPLPKPWPPTRWVMKLSTWNGKDLFGWPAWHGGPSASLIVTERIVKLAEEDGWTNIRFEPVEAA